MSQLTLLDIAKRNGSDAEIGLIEDVVTYAPEVGVLAVRPISGVTYKATLRTAYPTSAFRPVGAGVTPGKSSYVQKLAECFFIDGQLQVDESLPAAEDKAIGDVLADEAVGQMASVCTTLGAQFYYGTSADANGFVGIRSFVGTSADLSISAAGTGADTTTAYLVYTDIQGVHFVAGQTTAPSMGNPNEVGDPLTVAPPFRLGTWAKQQVVVGTSGAVQMAHVNNISGWLGLAYGSRYSAFSVRNIDLGNSSTFLTDTLGNKLLSMVPLRIRNSGRLRWFMNRNAAYSLQASRLPTTIVGQVGMGGIFPDLPKELGGIPITITDSITTAETNT